MNLRQLNNEKMQKCDVRFFSYQLNTFSKQKNSQFQESKCISSSTNDMNLEGRMN